MPSIQASKEASPDAHAESSTSAPSANAGSSAADQPAQFLTFVLDSEEYAIDILKVQEIKSWGEVTKVPRSPAYMLGVINLRGAIVPVVDLRLRFGLARAEITSKTAVIIVRAVRDESKKTMGLVVDQVSEVYHFDSAQIQESSTIGSNVDSEFIYGLAKAEDQLVIVLNLERIVSADDGLDAEFDTSEYANEQ